MTNLNLVPAFFAFDGFNTDLSFKGLHNPESRWNGWAMPYISSDSIEKLLSILHDDEYQIAKMQGQNVYLKNLQYEDSEAEILEPIEIEGEIYYYFGWLGFCFYAMPMAKYENRLHQEARDLMYSINYAHNWDSQLSLDDYLATHFDDITNQEFCDIQDLLDKFNNL